MLPNKYIKGAISVKPKDDAPRPRIEGRRSDDSDRFQSTAHGDAWDTEAGDLDDTTVISISNSFDKPDSRRHARTRTSSIIEDSVSTTYNLLLCCGTPFSFEKNSVRQILIAIQLWKIASKLKEM